MATKAPFPGLFVDSLEEALQGVAKGKHTEAATRAWRSIHRSTTVIQQKQKQQQQQQQQQQQRKKQQQQRKKQQQQKIKFIFDKK